MLRTGIGSCSSGSGRVTGGVTKLGLVVGAGVVLGPYLFRLGSDWLEKGAQLLQRLLHFEAVVDQTLHHLHTGVSCGLLKTVVEQSCFVEHIARIPQECLHLLSHLLCLVPLCPCSLDLLLGHPNLVLQIFHLLP